MELKNTVFSKLDHTIKYIFKNDEDYILEFSYINKNDGKDIICIPTQTMCNIGCKFCHCTDYIGKIKVKKLVEKDLIEGVEYLIKDLKLGRNNRTLLISFMGCGEPLRNYENVVRVMNHFNRNESYGIPYIRFSIATCIPESIWNNFFELTNSIYTLNLPVKIHLSLHYTTNSLRKEWMKNSLDILSSISALDFYKRLTGNSVEIHYCLIDGVNDTEQDAILLSHYLKDKFINVKFLFYNEKESIDYHASNKNKIDFFEKYMSLNNIQHEYYIPPGLDIGSSCGQFLLDYYTNN
jgi:23S rRNA (adenine2503-C2)-methyltransferase